MKLTPCPTPHEEDSAPPENFNPSALRAPPLDRARWKINTEIVFKKKVVAEAINPIHGNINYISELIPMATKNRNNPTPAEEIIWQKILRYKQTGYKFTRQKPINRFILDFYCSELNLAIEIDGSSHIKKKGTDKLRDKFLYQIGIETIRFTNEEILNNLSEVKVKIENLCSGLALSRGGGRPRPTGGVKNKIEY